MEIIVCLKYVPESSNVEVQLNEGGDGFLNGFSYDINDADNYALEEALLLKEAYPGRVTAVTCGNQEAEIMLRTALAKGCDRAIRIEDTGVALWDPFIVAAVLSAAIEKEAYDLVLTGCMASDYANMVVGAALAQHLGIIHTTLVKKIAGLNGQFQVFRELEGGLMEVNQIQLPALFTLQTGINQPRYASIRGIRAAKKKELTLLTLQDIGLHPEAVSSSSSKVRLERMYIPASTSSAVFLEGDLQEKAQQLLAILEKEGLI